MGCGVPDEWRDSRFDLFNNDRLLDPLVTN